MKSRFLFSAVVLLSAFALVQAADWPQWRGPDRTGISAEVGLLEEWLAEGPKLVWQVSDLGEGYSTPAVVGDRIYLISNEGMDNEYVHALSAKDGKQIWRTRIGNVGVNKGPQYPGSRSTPTVDGDSLYALGSDGDLVCLDTAAGNVKWSKNLRTDFGGQPGAWAYSESPLIDGDTLVVAPGGAEATIIALEKYSGAPIWKTPLEEGDQAAYASAIVVDAAGVKQYVEFLQKGLVGIEAKSGKFLWRYKKSSEGSPANIPTPIADKGLVYSSTGRGGGGLVKLKYDQGNVEAEEVYFNKSLPTSIGGAVEIDGFLYGTTGQGLVCADFATGEIRWQERGVGAGAVCFAEGRLYVHSEKDDVALVVASPDGYQEKGRFTLPDQPDRGRAQSWCYPVVANGKLYLRDLGVLWCYDVRK